MNDHNFYQKIFSDLYWFVYALWNNNKRYICFLFYITKHFIAILDHINFFHSNYVLLKYIISTVNFEKRKKSLYMPDSFKLICMSVSLVCCNSVFWNLFFFLLNFLCTVIFVMVIWYNFIHSWLSFNCEMKAFHFNNLPI